MQQQEHPVQAKLPAPYDIQAQTITPFSQGEIDATEYAYRVHYGQGFNACLTALLAWAPGAEVPPLPPRGDMGETRINGETFQGYSAKQVHARDAMWLRREAALLAQLASARQELAELRTRPDASAGASHV